MKRAERDLKKKKGAVETGLMVTCGVLTATDFSSYLGTTTLGMPGECVHHPLLCIKLPITGSVVLVRNESEAGYGRVACITNALCTLLSCS
jgi:hypothetical protein